MLEEHGDTIVFLVINNNRSQRPCYGQLKLKLRHSDIYYNVISLLLGFGHPPTTMDAVSGTIVAGGRALIQLNVRLIKIYDFYISLLILPKPFDSSLGMNIRKAARHSDGVDSSNPCRWKGQAAPSPWWWYLFVVCVVVDGLVTSRAHCM
jgi:hypothetical protein